jgi:hypothetical protein
MLGLGRNGNKVNLAVGENTIYIEEQKLDFAGAGSSG